MSVAIFPQESKTKTTHPLQLIYSDVMSFIKTPTSSGSRYVLSVVDDFSRYVTVYLVEFKSKEFSKLIECRSERSNSVDFVVRSYVLTMTVTTKTRGCFVLQEERHHSS